MVLDRFSGLLKLERRKAYAAHCVKFDTKNFYIFRKHGTGKYMICIDREGLETTVAQV